MTPSGQISGLVNLRRTWRNRRYGEFFDATNLRHLAFAFVEVSQPIGILKAIVSF